MTTLSATCIPNDKVVLASMSELGIKNILPYKDLLCILCTCTANNITVLVEDDVVRFRTKFAEDQSKLFLDTLCKTGIAATCTNITKGRTEITVDRKIEQNVEGSGNSIDSQTKEAKPLVYGVSEAKKALVDFAKTARIGYQINGKEVYVYIPNEIKNTWDNSDTMAFINSTFGVSVEIILGTKTTHGKNIYIYYFEEKIEEPKEEAEQEFFLSVTQKSLINFANNCGFNVVSSLSKKKILRIELAVVDYQLMFWVNTSAHKNAIADTNMITYNNKKEEKLFYVVYEFNPERIVDDITTEPTQTKLVEEEPISHAMPEPTNVDNNPSLINLTHMHHFILSHVEKNGFVVKQLSQTALVFEVSKEQIKNTFEFLVKTCVKNSGLGYVISTYPDDFGMYTVSLSFSQGDDSNDPKPFTQEKQSETEPKTQEADGPTWKQTVSVVGSVALLGVGAYALYRKYF